MRILVTNNSDLIGSNLVEHLLNFGHTVYSMDNLSTGDERNISQRARKNFYKVDLRRKDMVNLIMRIARPEIVFHCAEWGCGRLSQFTPNLILENNLNASMNILVASIKQGVKRIVFTSSVAIYGDQKSPFTEDMLGKPVSIYGITKYGFEVTLKIMSKVFGFEYVIVRPHNVYGPNMALSDPYCQVVGIFMNRILQDKPIYIYGDGNQKQVSSYVGDFIPALAKCGFLKEARNETFNIGADKLYSINELVETVMKVSGKKVEVKYIEDRSTEVDFAWCNNDKAKKILGFEDKTSLEEGIRKSWMWVKERGKQEMKYLPFLELVNQTTPKMWVEKLL